MLHSQISLYQSADGQIQLNVSLDQDTVWLTQRQMATLFDTSTDNISMHLKNIYDEAELDESATTEDFSVVQEEGARRVRRRIKHYNLDAVISVGYRVSSTRATQFRQWANRTPGKPTSARVPFCSYGAADRTLRATEGRHLSIVRMVCPAKRRGREG